MDPNLVQNEVGVTLVTSDGLEGQDQSLREFFSLPEDEDFGSTYILLEFPSPESMLSQLFSLMLEEVEKGLQLNFKSLPN